MNEEWRPVKGYEGLYEVSDLGRVRSLNWCGSGTMKVLVLGSHSAGYKQIYLHKDGNKKPHSVHRLVAESFLPNPKNLPQVNHKDLNKTNNCVENLEWCTASQNAIHYRRNSIIAVGTRSSKKRNTCRPITQFDADGNIIGNWENCLTIKHSCGYNQTSIFECCEGKRKTAYGYIWRYAS